MSELDRLYIADAGIVTPVGDNVETTCAAVIAGINRYQESPIYGSGLMPMMAATVPEEALPDLDSELEERRLTYRQQRMLRLGSAAAAQLGAYTSGSSGIPLFLAVPENIIPRRNSIQAGFIEDLAIQSGISFASDKSRVISLGRAAGAFAIDFAFQYLTLTEEEFVVVGGIDSYYDPYLMGFLDQYNRIKKANSMDAFVPSEGASFLVLTKEKCGSQYRIMKPGVAEEAGHRFSSEPYLGSGLATAFKEALSVPCNTQVSTIYSSMNGENFGSKEFSVATIRNNSRLSQEYQHHHPADCYGDIGAACIPAMITLALKNNENSCLIYGASDGAARGAVKLTKENV